MPGAGQMPLAEVMDLLRTERFDGFVSLEWERLWHPYLEPIDKALSEFAQQPWFTNHLPEVAAAPST
jgi:sugar phosphate isomerase/epimerase